MKRLAKTFGVLIALATPVGAATDSDSTNKYANYYAAQRALDRGDCDAAVGYLDAFLQTHSYVQEKYPDFYMDIEIVLGQCTGSIKVRGVEGESGEIDPLPDHPPMAE